MTTTTADEIAAVEAALLIAVQLAATSERDDRDEPEAIAGRTAFAAIVSRLRAMEAENARLLETVDTIYALLQTLPIGGIYTTEQHATVGKAYDLASLIGRTVSRPIESKSPPTDNG